MFLEAELTEAIINDKKAYKQVMEYQFVIDKTMVNYDEFGLPTVRGRQYMIKRGVRNTFGLINGVRYYQDVEVQFLEIPVTPGYK